MGSVRGSESRLSEIATLIDKGIKVSVKGSTGMGKTYTLKRMASIVGGIYFNRLSPRKEKILELISFLKKKGVRIQRSYRTLSRMRTEDLVNYLKQLKREERIFIFIDDLDKYTPRELELFQILDQSFRVVFSFSETNRKIIKYIYQTKVIYLKPFTKKQMQTILDEKKIDDPSTRIQIIQRSAGIPGVFFSILKNPESIKTVSSHPPKKIDMTWILLSFISLVIILRFIALGTNDTDKYIIAGILYGLTFMVRPFIYRGMRKEK